MTCATNSFWVLGRHDGSSRRLQSLSSTTIGAVHNCSSERHAILTPPVVYPYWIRGSIRNVRTCSNGPNQWHEVSGGTYQGNSLLVIRAAICRGINLVLLELEVVELESCCVLADHADDTFRHAVLDPDGDFERNLHVRVDEARQVLQDLFADLTCRA